ncbi:MAG: sensor histidine kinase [Legionella sp.]|nr:sensor histidine kinase [Legionella sp.]
MSIRNKILISMLMIVLLFIPVNIYLVKRYLDVKEEFLSIVDKTVPRLNALLTMKNLTTRINLFIRDFNYEFKTASINSNTSNKVGAVKDEFISLLNEFAAQQKLYKRYQIHLKDDNSNQLDRLLDDVIIAALEVFNAEELKLAPTVLNNKALVLKQKEAKLNALIKTLLLQESTILEEERDEIYNTALGLRDFLIFLNALIILVTLALNYFLMHVISKPLTRLSGFAKNIDYDNLKPLLPITSKDEIGLLQYHLNGMVSNLNKTKTTLIEISRAAGVAQLATSILHNVGNVLNSINTSVSLLSEDNNRSRVDKLPKLLSILEGNKNNLDYYLNQDEQGKLIIPYFQQLIEELENEHIKMQEELSSLTKNVAHVKQIIETQQTTCHPTSHILENFRLEALIEEILLIHANTLRKYNIKVDKQFTEVPPIVSVKNKIQQILINLVKNAIESVNISEQIEKKLIIKIEPTEQKLIKISIRDNGIGISKENIKKIFSFGFTTKFEGHGYGLHNCALLAKELGGGLTVVSEGELMGAVFTLDIPIEADKRLGMQSSS